MENVRAEITRSIPGNVGANNALLIHPLPMRTVFRDCFLANFAVSPEALATRLPPHIQPDVHHGRAFVSVVIARLEKMRPAFLPRMFGVTYMQVVYRAVVRCGEERGVSFLRSDADNSLMVLGGNALTFFRFHRANISWQKDSGAIRFSLTPGNGDAARIDADFDIAGGTETLPKSSCFTSLNEAQRALTELYVAFGPQECNSKVNAVRIQRDTWQSRVVEDRLGTYEAMRSGVLFNAGEAELDSVLYVESLNYHWYRRCFVEAGTNASVVRETSTERPS